MIRRTLAAGTVAAGAVVLLASPAGAHVSVSAPGAEPGGFATLTFSVPNERDDATTTSVQVTMPEDAPLAFVSVEPVPGWTVDVQRAALDEPVEAEGEGEELTEAVSSITWSGGSVGAGQFQRFVVSAGPLPEDADSLSFPAVQTYSDGEEVRWIEETPPGGEEPERPAPVLELTAADTEGDATSDTTEATAADDGADGSAADLSEVSDDADSAKALGILGIVVGAVGLLVALGALLARRRPTPGPGTS